MAEAVLISADIKRTILFRQFGFLVVLAASVALGVYVVLWSQTPNFSLLYGSLSDQDISQVLDTLQKSDIEYRVDQGSGAVMVPSAKVHDARMKLAGAGLPKNANTGFGMLQEEQGIGTSQFIEQARYQHALEGELAKTIEKLGSVRSARIHLAIPKQSTFVRNKKRVNASVMLDLYGGHELDSDQVSAIASLLAASVPNLDVGNVSIVDQRGRLMTQDDQSSELGLSSSQFKYTRRVEESYIKRIEDILSPIVGQEGVKAEVSAEFDFTSTEQTREMYNPDLPALRSEQVEEESRNGSGSAGGIPGALSNQPPANATLGGNSDPSSLASTIESGINANMQRRATRNYELDKTISHTRMQMGTMRRLSIAVLLDYKRSLSEDGQVTHTEHSPEELLQITALVKEAIGYNAVRGDSVNVMNAEFARPDPIELLPEQPIWQQSWVLDLAKQVVGGLFALFLVFGVLKPILKNLVNKEISFNQAVLAGVPAATALPGGAVGGQEQSVLQNDVPQLNSPLNYQSSLQSVQSMVKGDPKLTAQVVKSWVGEES
ncbi:MAG: flagellar M-ring protein FliF [Planctomycetota bacterium]|jgi:flagellar M-ring protein FliF